MIFFNKRRDCLFLEDKFLNKIKDREYITKSCLLNKKAGGDISDRCNQ